MENLTVLQGYPENPYCISLEGSSRRQEVREWEPKAAWQLLRFIYGYKQADAMIMEHGRNLERLKKEGKVPKDLSAAVDLLNKTPETVFAIMKRPLQFILDDDRVVAVATLKHLLVPPAQVYAHAMKIMKKKGYQLSSIDQLFGITYVINDDQRFAFESGLQIFGGDILTNKAIKVTSYCLIKSCLNPLSWLNVTVMKRFLGYAGKWERVVRIKVISELEQRLSNAIEKSIQNIQRLHDRMDLAKKRRLTIKQARILASAFGISYTLGAKTISQVIEQFESEDKTLYGLAQAFSWVSAHGELRKTPEGKEQLANQKLSTLAGATILAAENKADVLDAAKNWLMQRIKEGKLKTYEELLQEWNIP